MLCDPMVHHLYPLQLIAKASKDASHAGMRVLDLACGKGGDLSKWATHPDGVEKYVGSDIAFGSLQHLVERMASESSSIASTTPTLTSLTAHDLHACFSRTYRVYA